MTSKSRMTRSAAWSIPAAAVLLGVAACSDQPLATSAPAPAASLTSASGPYMPGQSYFGENDYVEYIAGNLPVIFTAPHGGDLEPAEIPLRTPESCGNDESIVVLRDSRTQEVVRAIQQAFFERTGGYPHIVINRLHRNRFEANRDLEGASCGSPVAAKAWHEWHAFIDGAKEAILAQHGRGFYTDIHGHGHDIQRLELGYELPVTWIRRFNSTLDSDPVYEQTSSIRTFSEESPLTFSQALRGSGTGLGSLFHEAGIPATPSWQNAAPAVGEGYFNGGYNTRRHSCSDGGYICGVQIEMHWSGVRDTERNRAEFAISLVDIYRKYLGQFGIRIPEIAPRVLMPGDTIVVDNLNTLNEPGMSLFRAPPAWNYGGNSQAYGENFALVQASSSATNQGAEFLFRTVEPGTYRIEAWWPAQSGRSETASYRVFETEGGRRLDDLEVSQRVNGKRWNELGTYSFTRAGWGMVLMSRSLAGPGSLAADAIRVTRINRSPVAVATFATSAAEGSAVSFDGSGSSDPDGDPLRWAWEFGDGGARAGALISYAFADDGSYDVELTVADRFGATHTTTGPITVTNVAPSVAIAAGDTILRGESYLGSGSFADPGADEWSAHVDYGDGSGGVPLALAGRSFELAHRYVVAGDFTVSVNVHDGDDTGAATVPVAVLTPVEGAAQLAALVRAHVTAGAITAGNGNALLAKLDAAAAQLERGNHAAAAGQLGAFDNQVDALGRSGRLPASEAGVLKGWVERITRSMASE